VTDAHIEDVSARAFTIPTDAPESDGTLEWESTTLVLATVRSGEPTGIAWTYGHAATAAVIGSDLAGAVQGRDALDVPGAWAAMVAAIRDLPYFEQMLAAEAVDVLQADVTRCGGITELLRVDALCRARSRRLSLHCAPTIHATRAWRSPRWSIWSTSTTTCASRRCCSRERRGHAARSCRRTPSGQASASRCVSATPSSTRSEPAQT
jgi:L-alanine-DL-glutamate epimerase-like enolase superfamily enzyme